MRTYFECVPCFVRQTLDAVRFVTEDETIHERVLRQVLHRASTMDLRVSPPAMGRYIHRLIRDLTGNTDPYQRVKDQSNRLALELYPTLQEKVERSPRPLDTAVRLAIAGNVIDFGVNSHFDDSLLHAAIEHSLTAPLSESAVDRFQQAVGRAEGILYLADNAGEIVFDRLLIERMPMDKVTFAVKGSPIINDATLADAQAAGVADLVEVVDNGSDAPGTILDTCSDSFRARFGAADLVVAKGQANYETLSDAAANVFFLLKAKCPVIARDLDCDVGSLVLQAPHKPV